MSAQQTFIKIGVTCFVIALGAVFAGSQLSTDFKFGSFMPAEDEAGLVESADAEEASPDDEQSEETAEVQGSEDGAEDGSAQDGGAEDDSAEDAGVEDEGDDVGADEDAVGDDVASAESGSSGGREGDIKSDDAASDEDANEGDWIIGLLYTCVAMLDSAVTSTVAAAGGQYTQAKHTTGPLMAFNVGLYLVLAYTMLEAADIFVFGDLVRIAAESLGAEAGSVDARPFVLLAVSVLAFLNYRGVFMTLTVNFLITAVAFCSIIVLVIAYQFGIGTGESLQHGSLGMGELPYGWMGVLAAFQFGIWYYLGIEGTCQAAEEVRSCGRSLPLGTMTGMITLLIAAALTWYVCAGTLPWEYLGTALAPLYDASLMSGSSFLIVLLWIGTVFSALASANGCINDAARAWFSMGRDRYLPEYFAAVHPVYRTPFRAIIFLIPIAAAFGFLQLLAPTITFSILSGLLGYTFMPINMFRFRSKWPLGSIKRGYVHPFHPLPAITLLVLCIATYIAVYLGFGTQLLAMMLFYIVASIWFVLFRYKYVRRGDQFTMAWPRPKGY